MANAGIDYGLGVTNINRETGIRYGVISSHSVGESWYESAEADYGDPHCPECGNAAVSSDDIRTYFADDDPDWFIGKDYFCLACEECFWSESAFPDEALGYSYEADGYKLCDCLDSDIMVLDSPYFTYARFCSPCVPGAGNLDDAADLHPTADDGVKTYCLGHDWFDGSRAPYTVYSVATGAVVEAS